MVNPVVEARAEQLVRDHWKAANVRDVHINDRIPHFLRGALYIVTILDAHGDEHENYVYVTGDDLRRFDDLKQLGAGVGRDTPMTQFLASSFKKMSVAGIIAICITLTICYLVATHPETKDSIPALLGNALTLILGFYFGTTARTGSK